MTDGANQPQIQALAAIIMNCMFLLGACLHGDEGEKFSSMGRKPQPSRVHNFLQYVNL